MRLQLDILLVMALAAGRLLLDLLHSIELKLTEAHRPRLLKN